VLRVRFLVIGMASCQKEDLVIEWAAEIDLKLETESDKRFISINDLGITKALTATEAKTTNNEILFVWEIDPNTYEVLVMTPNHSLVGEYYPEVKDVELAGATELRESPIVEGEIDDLIKNGSKAKMKEVFESAKPLADIGVMPIGDGGGVCALMDKYRHVKLQWHVVRDEQGRILYQNVIGGLCFTIGGGYALYNGAWSVIQSAIASKGWPSTEATIIENTLRYEETYKLRFNVEYEVAGQYYFRGKPYLGDFGNFAWDTGEAEFIAKYTEYSKHPIYYNPNNPQEATLEQGFKWSYLTSMGFFMLFFVVGLLFLLGTLMQIINGVRREREQDYV